MDELSVREKRPAGQLLRGRVLEASGAPPQGAVVVHRFSLRAGSRVLRLKAEADGSFEMPIGIPAVVLASSTIGGAGAAPATGYEPSFALRLQPRLEIHGRVLDAAGAPLAGVRITQVLVLRFTDKLVFATPPNDAGRVERRGNNVFLAPCFCLSSLATTDADGLFRLFGLPACDGSVLLRATPPEKGRCAPDIFWIPAEGFSDLVLRGPKGPSLRLPDGTPVDGLPVEPEDPAVADEPLPPLLDLREQRREWIRKQFQALRAGTPVPFAGDLLAELAEALHDPDAETRSQSILVLASLNAPEALDVLTEALRNPDPVVRREALLGLGRLGTQAACRPRVLETLRRVVDDSDPSFDVVLAACGALVEMGESTDAAPFYEALRRDDADERIAARALAQLLQRDAIELIVTRMERSAHGEILGGALEALTGARRGDQAAKWKIWLLANRGTLPPQEPTDDRLPDAAAYLRRAQARLRRKDVPGARADLDATLRRDGPSAMALGLRAWIRMEQGDLDGAWSDVEHSLRLNARDMSVRTLRSVILDRRQKRDAAAAKTESDDSAPVRPAA
jgi:tetratricopeptide (TPR) repeat protein